MPTHTTRLFSHDTALEDMRQEYPTHPLLEQDVENNPIAQFKIWFEQAKNGKIFEPNAMTVATVNARGLPSARTVLLKHFDEDGFVFYTNYHSDKAADIHDNPAVCLHFLWTMNFDDGPVDRSVRIKGYASKLERNISVQYFSSRPRASQLGAWASPQSKVINGREELDNCLEKVSKQFDGKKIPTPPHWGGFRVAPFEIEFWQGAASRLHDRIRYRLNEKNEWQTERLAP